MCVSPASSELRRNGVLIGCWQGTVGHQAICPNGFQILEAVAQGMADVQAGRVISDEELGERLDAELGPLVVE